MFSYLTFCSLVCQVFFIILFIYYLFICFGCAGSSLLCGLFSRCDKRGLLFIAARGLLTAVVLLVAEYGLLGVRVAVVGAHGLSNCGSWALSTGSTVVAYGLSCSVACGTFPDQGSNLCLPHWQADSLPPSP